MKSSRANSTTNTVAAYNASPVAQNVATMPKWSKITPPNSGPSAVPRNSAAIVRPVANGRRSRGVCPATSAMIVGTTPLVAPIKNLLTTSCVGFWEYPESTKNVPPNNIARMMLRRRPYRSPMMPQNGANRPIPTPIIQPDRPERNAARSTSSTPSD